MGGAVASRTRGTFFAIPIDGRYILYRPLLRLAFVGNEAMVALAGRALQGMPAAAPGEGEAREFLEKIGFLRADPEPPPPPSRSFHPTTAVLLLTSRCNLRCVYCYANGGQTQAIDLALEPARLVIDHVCACATAMGRPHFDVTFHGGGEPTRAWATLQELTAYARGRKLGCRVSLVSNGVWTRSQLSWILKNVDNLTVSFDGNEGTQNEQRPTARGGGSFRAVMRTLRALDASGSPYGIRMTALAPWRDRLAQDVAFICRETACRAIQVEPAFNTERGAHAGPTATQAREFADGFMQAFEVAGKAGRRLVYSGARPWLLTRAFCTAPYGAMIVDPHGRLVACYEVTDEGHPLGRLSTYGAVSSGNVTVDGRARQELLSYLETGRAGCCDCFCLWHCAGDCYTRASAASSGAVPGTSPRCLMNREITARMLLWYIAAGDGVWRGHGFDARIIQLMNAF